MSSIPAILFLVFNRPETTMRVFDAIRDARPPRLYVAADGPRARRAGEAERCNEVRRVATAVDWPCEVRTLFRDANLGCRRAVAGAVSWFFEHEPEGIILEDDTVPTPAFFPYCASMLERYRDRADVFMVAGYNHVPRAGGRVGHFLSRYAQIWGWATWADRWRLYDETLPDFEKDFSRARAAGFIKHWEGGFWRQRLDEVRVGSLDTWDHQWQFTVLKHNGRCVRPTCNLVANIGFGPEATHTRRENAAVAANTPADPAPARLDRRVRVGPFEDARFFERKLRNRSRLSWRDYLHWTLPAPALRLVGRTRVHARDTKRLLRQAWARRRSAVPAAGDAPRCLVVSPGGVATTALMTHLSAFIPINDAEDRDDLKHLPTPPAWLTDDHRVVFLTGCPRQIEASLVRRGWRARQGAKLGSLGAVLLPGTLGRHCLRRAASRQMAAWCAYAAAHPGRVRVVPFDEIWARQNEISAFFGIHDALFIEAFPQRRARQSA